MRVDTEIPSADELSELIELSVRSASIGAVWLDSDLIVRRRLGVLAEPIVVGSPVGDSLLALYGQDERLQALRTSSGEVLHLSNVTNGNDAPQSPRLRITVHWSGPIERYIVVLSRVAEGDVRSGALEDEMRKRRIADAALGQLNQQLEEFVHIISHDLKEPMRTIRYLAGALADELPTGGADLDNARTRCHAIQGQARRMSAMLLDLLEYSRIGREFHEPELLDVSHLVFGLIESHAARSGITLAPIGVLPRIKVLRVPFELVVRNLVANGIKHHDRKTGRVEFSMRDAGNRWIIDITDDGPGIPRDAQDDIFLPFRKLSLDADLESTGIGLALVRRAVESVGGRITVHSDPVIRRGTRFEVEWPKPSNAPQ